MVITNNDLYKLTAELTIVDDTPEDVRQVWEGLWEIVYNNYLDHASSEIKGFANFGYDSDGAPNAKLSQKYVQQHGFSTQKQQELLKNAARTPTLVTIGKLNRDFVSCIINNMFTALGNLCRGTDDAKIQLGKVGYFLFNGTSRFYKFKLAEITQIHPGFRQDVERLCELANKEGDYKQFDQKKHTDKITHVSGARPDLKQQPEFNLISNKTYKGKCTQPINVK